MTFPDRPFFETDLDIHLSKQTLEVLRMSRDLEYPDIKDFHATSEIAREIINQGLWPGIRR